MAKVPLTAPLAVALLSYYDVLSRWNAKMNLTSLRDEEEAFDRLLLEPVAAARALPSGARLMDLGSGGGSPGIPLALALDASELVMVESKARKTAFLREAARSVGVNATVETTRFEDLVTRPVYAGGMDVVSMRAVRMDPASLETAGKFTRESGVLALFVTTGTQIASGEEFHLVGRYPLVANAELLTLGRPRLNVPRGTQI